MTVHDDNPLYIFMTDPHSGGGGQVRYVTNLARELVRMGHRVTFGCRAASVLVQKAQDAGCDVENSFQFRGGLRLNGWRSDIARLTRYVRDKKPDIVHVNLSQDHWTAGVAMRLSRYPACLVRTRHNTYPVKDSLPNRLLNRNWTDFQIVVCDIVHRKLASQPTFDVSRMCSIHNGVDAEIFRPNPAARLSARESFGYPEDDFVVGIAARLVPAKGHEFLFRATALLRNDLPRLRILVLGQGELESQLRTLAEDLGIASIVNFAGFREDTPFCLQALDIGIQPSIDCDTSSFSLKEQMACEKAVIASDYGGLSEIVTDGVEGLVVPAGTVEPLAAAIRKLAGDAELRRRMGAAGRERVLKDFTVEVFARRTVDAYRRAMELHRSRHGHAGN